VSDAENKHEQRLAWVQDGTARLQADLARLADADLNAPSLLPGWTRRHLLAHVAANADALCRLAYWARTGEERRMYSSAQQRNAEIEVGAVRPAAEIRNWITDSAAQLADDLGRLTDDTWQAMVVTAQGRTVPATEIPWLRAREVWVHAADLGAGTTFGDMPPEFLTELLDDVAARRAAQGTGPALSLTATDTGGTWHVAGTGEAYAVEAPRIVLGKWLTGRSAAGLRGAELPDLPPWL
jgi:maleylpyruvate isomerase